ncbi:MAG: IS66 family insertion sequence element accessory protein TnpB [Planctomycetota bacterium]
MIGTTRVVKVFAYARPADLRKGYNGLFGLVQEELGHDPLTGAMYVFVNRRRTSCKVLFWDGTGLCLFCKRLEEGQFASFWRGGESRVPVSLTSAEMMLFLEGCELVGRRVLSPPASGPKTLATPRAV